MLAFVFLCVFYDISWRSLEKSSGVFSIIIRYHGSCSHLASCCTRHDQHIKHKTPPNSAAPNREARQSWWRLYACQYSGAGYNLNHSPYKYKSKWKRVWRSFYAFPSNILTLRSHFRCVCRSGENILQQAHTFSTKCVCASKWICSIERRSEINYVRVCCSSFHVIYRILYAT